MWEISLVKYFQYDSLNISFNFENFKIKCDVYNSYLEYLEKINTKDKDTLNWGI